MNDPIREIDMSDGSNFQRAVELALAASDPEGWGEISAESLRALGKAPDLWTVYKDEDHPEGCSVIAITGDGPNSKANAEFIASARRVVLGLISEVDRLKTILRSRSLEDDPSKGKRIVSDKFKPSPQSSCTGIDPSFWEKGEELDVLRWVGERSHSEGERFNPSRLTGCSSMLDPEIAARLEVETPDPSEQVKRAKFFWEAWRRFFGS